MSRDRSQTRTRRDRPPGLGSKADGPTGADALAPGDRLAEYIVEEKLGEGGAGVVYKARDPDLNRSIAIKLLRGSMFSVDSSARARLVREAQAMAKLCHPNVVTIYHVGTFQHRIFIAMEYVSGGTLRTWLGDKARSMPEILDVWTQAAQGLIAAHASGLVHRDFKPDNVLIGESGRVRVTDFGLVTSEGADVEEASKSPDTPLTVSITVEGSILGTPAYMAPEQHEGFDTDARTDQFSFCVSLYEALYGQRPFVGATYPSLAVAVLTGKIREVPSDTAVPAYLHRILLRGMSTDPSDRFESMQHLLEELSQGGQAPGHTDLPTRVDDITRDRIRELTVVERHGRLQLGLAIIEEISDRMDAFGDDALCAEFLLAAGRLYAGLHRYDESDEHLRKCLLMAARANTPPLEAAAISELICVNRLEESHPQSAESMIMAGQSAVARADTDEQRARFTIALARLDNRRGRYAQAQERLHQVLELWQTKLRHDPTLLDIGLWAHVLLNEVNDELQPEIDSVNHYQEVLKLAGEYQHPLMAGVHCNVARDLQHQGAYEEAEAHHVEALDLYRRAFGEWDERVAMCLSNLGRCKVVSGRVDEGIVLLKEGLAMSEQILGPDDLQVANALLQLGVSMVNAQISGAEHCLLRCLEIQREQLPDSDPAIADTYNHAGVVFWAMNKGPLAYAQFEEAARRYEVAALAHLESMSHHNMARLCCQYGNPPQALVHAERSVDLNPANHDSCFLLAQLLWSTPKEQERALAIAKSTIAACRDSGETEAAKIVADWYAEKTGKGEEE
jgi:serine/threonine protein kinase